MKKSKQPVAERLYCNVPKKFIEHKSIRNTSNKTSNAYTYFVVFVDARDNTSIKETHLHCKECFKKWDSNSVPKIQQYSLISSTGNMFTHLEKEHGIHATNVDNSLKLTSFFEPVNKCDADTDYFFLLWIALDNLPLSKVEGKGFRLLMEKIAKSVKVPSRATLTRRCLPGMYGAFKLHILQLIAAEVHHYTLAIDIWTDDFQKLPYLAFVLHYGFNSKRREILLEILPFLESHTGIAISKQIKRVVEKFELDSNHLRIVSDSASNNILAAGILKCKWQPCIAHRINTAVTTSLDTHVASFDVLKKCRKIYKFLLFKKHELDEAAEMELAEIEAFTLESAKKEAEELKAAEEEANKIIESVSEHFDVQILTEGEDSSRSVATTSKAKRIKIDVKTRWNSTYLMLQSMIDLESRILTVLRKLEKRDLAFNDTDLVLIKRLLTILKPFYDLTLIASKSTGEDNTIRLVFEILETLEHLEKMTTVEKNQQILMLLIGLKTNLIQKVDISEEMIVSVVLDPFLKDAPNFKNYLEKRKIDSFHLLKRYAEQFNLADQVSNQIQSEGSNQEAWRAKIRKIVPSSEDVSRTISRYLATDFSSDTSAKDYWKANPGCLSKLFDIVFYMPFSSVSV